MSMCAGRAMLQDAAEPMQVDVYYEENDNVGAGGVGSVENTTLDLEQYAANYRGLAKLFRLLHIANHCPSLQVEALRMAMSCVMLTYNTNMYQQIHKKLQEAVNNQSRLPDAVAGVVYSVPALDTQWIELTSKKAALRLEKLDTDLKNYKSNSIKESIRRGHDDLGDHYLECGDLSNALKCYSRARDYCTSAKHCVTMCMNVIKVSIYLQNWSHVISYVNKAESTPFFAEPGRDGNQQQLTKLRVAAGLADMVCMKFKSAAKLFLQANIDHVDFPEMLSANNVATYGALCALATFDRQELQRLVICNSSFKLFLELEPQLRDILHSFYESKYAKCLKLLDEIKNNLLLDLYLASHVDELYGQIRSRALCQYFSPYVSADMNKMAQAFNTTVGALEDELMLLIMDGRINARIDSHSKVLYAKDIDQRSQTFSKSIEMARDFQRKAKALILRTAIIRSQIKVMGTQGSSRDGAQGSEVSQFVGENAQLRFLRLTGSATA